ncbi:phage tail protein [Vibrio cidicii]|uniref:Phage tail protein n=1 Tax=Vibrio cidicii TaxID=1763883 RepID=A0A151L0R2_9VIBR|nr:tail fiber protein [Vibrio cidicii]KYN89850.1 phage tail protein [Vibrio cidicii]
MSDPFIGQVTLYGYSWAPKNWSLCNGQIIQVSQNPALFSLMGSAYGGDGRTTFALPDFRGRVPVGLGTLGDVTYERGNAGGAENVTLTLANIAHTHDVQASTKTANSPLANIPGPNQMATQTAEPIYAAASNLVNTSDSTVSSIGDGQSHNNMQPSLSLNFAIALTGIYPSRN